MLGSGSRGEVTGLVRVVQSESVGFLFARLVMIDGIVTGKRITDQSVMARRT